MRSKPWLRAAGKTPSIEICRWNPSLRKETPEPATERPTAEMPLVFHACGHVDEIDSMVVTEDDHLDFVMNLSRSSKLLPLPVQRALASSSLLYLGVTVDDMASRSVFRGLIDNVARTLRRPGIAIPALPANGRKSNVATYFERSQTRVFWLSLEAFSKELLGRWNQRGPLVA